MDCDRHNISQVVIGVFADQIDAAWCAIHVRRVLAAKLRAKSFRYDGCFRESHKSIPPKSAIEVPAYRSTLIAVNGAAGEPIKPSAMRIAPTSIKNEPEVTRRSISVTRRVD